MNWLKLFSLLTMWAFASLATAQTPAPFPIGQCRPSLGNTSKEERS